MIKKFFKILLFFPPIIAAIFVLQYIISQKELPTRIPVAERSQHVRIIEATKYPLIPRILGYGTAQPSHVWRAVAQVSGKVVFIHPDFKKGSMLKKGTVVIRIAKDDYLLAIKQAEANIRSAQAKLAELKVSEANTKGSLKIERQTLKISNRELGRKKKLARRKTIAQSLVDQQTRSNLAQRQKMLNLANALKLIPTQRLAQKEQIAVFNSQLETAKLNLSRTSLSLPFDALIAEEKAEITQFVNVGQELGSADGIELIEVNAQIASSKFMAMVRSLTGGKFAKGIDNDTLKRAVKVFNIETIVRSNAGIEPIIWKGTLERISDSLDAKTRTLGMLVTVKDSLRQAVPGYHPPLMKGSFVEVEISAKTQQKAISIPRSALHGKIVWVVDKDNRLRFKQVTPLLFQGNYVILKEGLNEGDKIVISSMSPAIKGALLKTTLDTAAAKQLLDEIMGKGALK